jgi:hypothetical protein
MMYFLLHLTGARCRLVSSRITLVYGFRYMLTVVRAFLFFVTVPDATAGTGTNQEEVLSNKQKPFSLFSFQV